MEYFHKQVKLWGVAGVARNLPQALGTLLPAELLTSRADPFG
jgi:hypothetical protein